VVAELGGIWIVLWRLVLRRCRTWFCSSWVLVAGKDLWAGAACHVPTWAAWCLTGGHVCCLLHRGLLFYGF